MKSKLLRLVKVIVSVSLIAILIGSVDWSEIFSQANELSAPPALLAVVLLSLQYPISAWKWRKSLRLHGVEYGLGYLLRILCIAFFFNNFLPSAIGGDAYRAYRTFEHAGRPVYSISAVIVERVLGLIALVVLGYGCAIALVVNGTLPYQQEMIFLSAVSFLFLALFGIAWKTGHLGKIEDRLHKVSKLEPIMESVRTIRENRQHMLGLVCLSLLFQAIAIAAIALLFSALALPGVIFESGVTATVAGVAGVIPLSINGIGIVEGSFAVAAVVAGLAYSKAVIVALFVRVYGLASSIIFGVLYILERDKGSITDERPAA
ncbi:MAG: lysylphosphatidylglycerol synthase transmembrane domain-containing protein [Woeseiaceae bacterium]